MSPKPLQQFTYDQLAVSVYADNETMGQAAAEAAAIAIDKAIAKRGVANIILATGNSQLTFLHSLRELPSISWPAVNIFHLDEYVGLSPGHPARFSLFLRRHLLDHVAVGAFYPVPGSASNVDIACQGYELILRAHHPIDLCCLGIGENGHLAFNDPPAAFHTEKTIQVVKLAEAARKQQVGEGHFNSLEDVPEEAITLTVPTLLEPNHVLAVVPERRKAPAVKDALEGPVTEECPASILRTKCHATLYLDKHSASLLDQEGGP